MSNPIITVREGKVRGKLAIDFNGEQFYSFQGIPYAKPPLGILRFKVCKNVYLFASVFYKIHDTITNKL